MAKITDHLAPEFIIELFKACFDRESVFDIVRAHLKYAYLVEEVEKKFWKEVLKQHTVTGKRPSLGKLQLLLRNDDDCFDYISKVKNTEIEDYISIIEAFQLFVKQGKFVELYESTGDLYNKGDQEKAFKIFIKGAEELNDFSIKDNYYERIFKDFESRNAERQGIDYVRKVPFSIDEMDYYSRGGPEVTDTVLVLGESGIGKSQFLTHYGINTARRGGRVAHFQIEGTKKQAMDRYDAAWTGTLYHDMKVGLLAEDKYNKIKNTLKKIGKGEIYVEAYEKFGNATINDVRNSFRDMKKLYGEFDLILIDYLELLELGDGLSYGDNGERFRQEKIGRFMKELAMEERVVVATVTQSSNVNFDIKSDEEFVITRDYLADHKGKLRPFDYFFTINQTPTEKQDNQMRIYADKMREHKSGQTMKIVSSFKNSRFYDKKKTLALIEELEEKK